MHFFSLFSVDRCYFRHVNARSGDVVCALWLIHSMFCLYAETYHFISPLYFTADYSAEAKTVRQISA
jgi:hypothetical protein